MDRGRDPILGEVHPEEELNRNQSGDHRGRVIGHTGAVPAQATEHTVFSKRTASWLATKRDDRLSRMPASARVFPSVSRPHVALPRATPRSLPLQTTAAESRTANGEGRESTVSRVDSRPSESGRQDLNLRPLGPEPAPPAVPAFAPSSTSSQPLDNTRDAHPAIVDEEPLDTPNGARGESFPEQVAADLRQTEREFLRPELLLTAAEVAERLGVSLATVHNKIGAGMLRAHLFGNQRRVRPEDLDAYLEARQAERPPQGENWRTVRDLMRAANVSRAVVYRLIRRGSLPARTFCGIQYIRREDFEEFLRSRGDSSPT
jgi:excisionase family DNA binding protein